MLSRLRKIHPEEAHLRLRREMEIALQNWYLNHDPEVEPYLWQAYWQRHEAYRAFWAGLRRWKPVSA